MSHRPLENFSSIIPKALLLIGLCAITSCSSDSSFSEKFGFTKKATDLGPRRLPRDNQKYMGYGQQEQPAYQAQAPYQAPPAPQASGMQGNAPYGMPPMNYAPAPQAAAPYVPPAADYNPARQAALSNEMPPMPSYQQVMNESRGAAPTAMIPSYNAQPTPMAPAYAPPPMAPAYAPPPPASMLANNAPVTPPQPVEKPSFFSRLFKTTPPAPAPAPAKTVTPIPASVPIYSSGKTVQVPSEDPSHNIYYTPKAVPLTLPTELPAVKTAPVKDVPVTQNIKTAPLPLTLKKNMIAPSTPVYSESPQPIKPLPQTSSQKSSFSFGKLFAFDKPDAAEKPKPHTISETSLPPKNFASPAPVAVNKPKIKEEKTASQNSFSFTNLFSSKTDMATKTGNALEVPPLAKPDQLPEPKVTKEIPWKEPVPLPLKLQKESHNTPMPEIIAPKDTQNSSSKKENSGFSKFFGFTKKSASPEANTNNLVVEAVSVTPAQSAIVKSVPASSIQKVGMKGYPDLATVPQKPQRFNESNAIKEDMNDLLQKQQEIESSKNSDPADAPAPLPLKIDQPPAMAIQTLPEKLPEATVPSKPAIITAKPKEDKPAPEAARPMPYAMPLPAALPSQPKAAAVMPLPPVKEIAVPARLTTQAPSTPRAPQRVEPMNITAPDPSLAERARMRAKLYNEQYGSLPAAPEADENSDSRNYR